MLVNIHTHHPKPEERTLSIVGIHPYNAEAMTTDMLLLVNQQVASYHAVGEIGLDFVCSTDRKLQEQFFRAQLEIAQHAGKGVVIHCVKAFECVMKILSEYTLRFVIFHGFIGSTIQAKRAISKGYFLSFGERTFRSPKTIESLLITPTDRLFLETDDSTITIEEMYTRTAEILSIPEPILCGIINANFDTICG